MKKLFILMILSSVFILTGCNSNNTSGSRQPDPVPVQPVAPVQPEPEPEPSIPGIGTGSVSYNPSCESGFAKVTYIYREDANIDSNSFVIVHSVNGVRESINSASVFNNGSVAMMEEQIYIQANDTDKQKAHQIKVDFIADGVSQVQSFSFLQPACVVEEPEVDEPTEETDEEEVDDNTTAVVMSVDIK